MKQALATLLCGLSLINIASSGPAQDKPPITIIKHYDSLGFLEPIPVHVRGLSGEADSVLKNDLTFMGVVHKSLEEAKFLIDANASAGRAEARVVEKVTKNVQHEAAFTAASQRAAVHALADSIAKSLTGLPNIGIAQTKATFKVEPSRGRSEVYIADYDGFGAQAVTQDKSLVSAPCWAGHGMLVYSSYKLGNPYIFSHVLGSGARNAVAKHPGNNYSPAVSADGRRVAMILNMNGTPNLTSRTSMAPASSSLPATGTATPVPAGRPTARRSALFRARAGRRRSTKFRPPAARPRRCAPPSPRARPSRIGRPTASGLRSPRRSAGSRCSSCPRPAAKPSSLCPAKIPPGRPTLAHYCSAADPTTPSSCLCLTCRRKR